MHGGAEMRKIGMHGMHARAKHNNTSMHGCVPDSCTCFHNCGTNRHARVCIY
jgi:hypothetical protein